jgi:hypothetical protein
MVSPLKVLRFQARLWPRAQTLKGLTITLSDRDQNSLQMGSAVT